ncbi:DUF4260 domain-containing protein [Hansschlegelia beijingensis]|uniref:DUF4260 family protein n=1 Tax=Hansschlegelia beijingensis TaxID=1133344 RepID=A0A7W6D0H6_9HYPH|nr:DUF4260 domain-containing protein [Hansschlegelia beijingensis]MBB3973732.1 hypothetical protein [Hansschlegelia beijingensis]
MTEGYVQGAPRSLLRLEGAALLLFALVGYWWSGQPWWLLAALVLVPDLSMLGYLAGPKVGAALYNAAHSTTAPLVLLSGSALLDDRMTLGLALIWLAHIGFDRALGYGLKYVSGFGDTHLGPLGGRL